MLIQLAGKITEAGKLEIELPEGLPPGDVQVTIEMPAEAEIPWEDRPWTDEELADMLKTNPQSGAEIVDWLKKNGGWEDLGITDGAEWVQEQRRKNQRKFPEW